MQIEKLEIPALCLGNMLGAFAPIAQTVWIAAFLKSGEFTAAQIGWLGSGELLCVALGTIGASAWIHRVRVRSVAIVTTLLIAIANAVSALPPVQTFVMGRLSSGLAMGVLLAITIGAVARRTDAQRVYSLMTLLGIGVVSTFYFTSPVLVGRYGAPVIFLIVAGVGLLTAAVAWWGFPFPAPVPAATLRPVDGGASNFEPQIAPVLGCMGMATIAVGISTVATYMIVIGNGLGFSSGTMGKLMGSTLPLAIVGALAARILGERAGLVWPLRIALTLLSVGFLFIVTAPTPVLLWIYLAIVDMAAMFYVPYVYTLVSRVDRTGRFASAMPAFIMMGNAAGPTIGSHLLGSSHFQALAAVGITFIVAGMLLLEGAARTGGLRRLQPTQSLKVIT